MRNHKVPVELNSEDNDTCSTDFSGEKRVEFLSEVYFFSNMYSTCKGFNSHIRGNFFPCFSAIRNLNEDSQGTLFTI